MSATRGDDPEDAGVPSEGPEEIPSSREEIQSSRDREGEIEAGEGEGVAPQDLPENLRSKILAKTDEIVERFEEIAGRSVREEIEASRNFTHPIPGSGFQYVVDVRVALRRV